MKGVTFRFCKSSNVRDWSSDTLNGGGVLGGEGLRVGVLPYVYADGFTKLLWFSDRWKPLRESV